MFKSVRGELIPIDESEGLALTPHTPHIFGQLDTIYQMDQNNPVSPFFSEESYFLYRMSEIWGEELWENVELEQSEPITQQLPQSPVSLCCTTA
jgi:hypothetical protein